MREMIKMVVVLVILSSFSGGLLAAVRNSTKDKIELQQLTFVKGPAIKSILEGASNDPIVDRFNIEYEGDKYPADQAVKKALDYLRKTEANL